MSKEVEKKAEKLAKKQKISEAKTKEKKSKEKKDRVKYDKDLKDTLAGKETTIETTVLTSDVVLKPETTTAISAAPAAPAAPAALKPSPEMLEHCTEAMEALEGIGDDMRLPLIKLTNDGFEMSSGAEPVDEFTGVLLYNKLSNVYYEGKYKPGDTSPPLCMSSNGKFPDSEVEKPQFDNCAKCPKNQWKSDPAGGDGKACKNTKPIFILITEEGEEGEEGVLSVIPKVLRVPPTSIKMLDVYIMDVGGQVGSLFNIETKFSLFKKDESQAYYNIKFSKNCSKFPAQIRCDVKHIRDQWKTYMKEGMFGIDADTVDEPNEKVVSAQPDSGNIDY